MKSNYQGKILVLGPKGVGKSSIVNAIVGKDFNPSQQPTYGSSLSQIQIEYLNIVMKLNLLDISCDTRFRKVTPHYYECTTVVIAVYDSSNPKSYCEMISLLEDFLLFVKHRSNVSVFIVANKIDLSFEQLSLQPEVLHHATLFNAKVFQTSAFLCFGIERLFQNLLENCYDDFLEQKVLKSYVIVPNSLVRVAQTKSMFRNNVSAYLYRFHRLYKKLLKQ